MNRFITTPLTLVLLCLGTAAFAAEKEEAPVGYGGAIVQMAPIMAPYRTSGGMRYEVLILRMTLDTGPKERGACFSIPMVHDRFVTYLYSAKLTAADFVGQRREVLEKNLFDVAVKATDKGYYSNVSIVGSEPEELDPKSQTLSTQCK